jgi:hypothetical protein
MSHKNCTIILYFVLSLFNYLQTTHMFSILGFIRTTHKVGSELDSSQLDKRRNVFATRVLKEYVYGSQAYWWPFSFFINSYVPPEPVTVAARSKAWIVFRHSEAGIVGLNPTQGVCILCVYAFVLSLFCSECSWGSCHRLIARQRSPTVREKWLWDWINGWALNRLEE